MNKNNTTAQIANHQRQEDVIHSIASKDPSKPKPKSKSKSMHKSKSKLLRLQQALIV